MKKIILGITLTFWGSYLPAAPEHQKEEHVLSNTAWLADTVQTYIATPAFYATYSAIAFTGKAGWLLVKSLATGSWSIMKLTGTLSWEVIKKGSVGIYYGTTCPVYFVGGIAAGFGAKTCKSISAATQGNAFVDDPFKDFSCDAYGDWLQCQCAGAGSAVEGIAATAVGTAVTVAPLVFTVWALRRAISRARGFQRTHIPTPIDSDLQIPPAYDAPSAPCLVEPTAPPAWQQ